MYPNRARTAKIFLIILCRVIKRIQERTSGFLSEKIFILEFLICSHFDFVSWARRRKKPAGDESWDVYVHKDFPSPGGRSWGMPTLLGLSFSLLLEKRRSPCGKMLTVRCSKCVRVLWWIGVCTGWCKIDVSTLKWCIVIFCVFDAYSLWEIYRETFIILKIFKLEFYWKKFKTHFY